MDFGGFSSPKLAINGWNTVKLIKLVVLSIEKSKLDIESKSYDHLKYINNFRFLTLHCSMNRFASCCTASFSHL